jgi:hypothetical protein
MPPARRSLSAVVKLLLDASWYFVALALGLAVCLLLLVTFSQPSQIQLALGIPVTFEMTLRADGPPVQPVQPLQPLQPVQPVAVEQARIEKGSGTLIVPIDQGGVLYATVTTLIVLLAIGLWILGQLCAVFRTVRDGKPFTAANVRRIRWVGVGVILGEFVASGSAFFGNSYAASHIVWDGVQFGGIPIVSPTGIMHGLVILAIAEVFRTGTRLDEDQSLTI